MQGFLNATDNELLQHSRETAETIYHPFATARIGVSLPFSPFLLTLSTSRSANESC